MQQSGVESWRQFRGGPEDILLIHYSLGSPAFDSVFSAPGRKALVYHNVTPAPYLTSLPSILKWAEAGKKDLASFATRAEAAIAHSHFSARDLLHAGYRSVEVLPYTLFEKLYEQPAEDSVLKLYPAGDQKNLLVVGRIMPHKCVEDSVFVVDYLGADFGAGWRLILIGSWNGAEAYRERLLTLAEKMNLQDIVWAGAVSQGALISYYKIADALLLMSEHEGFGVPLVEAMRYEVPVFAYSKGATPEVLGDAGVLIEQKNFPLIAETIELVTSDPLQKETVLQTQRDRREFFSSALAKERWRTWLARFS